MFRNVFGGVSFVLFLFITSFLGVILQMGPTLPLIFIKPTWFRWISDKLLRTWLPLPMAILEVLFGTKLHITEECFPAKKEEKNVLIIMNHRTRLDWLYYFNVMLRHKQLLHHKIVLKNELKYIPGAGWAMQACMFLFLKRRWNVDGKYLYQILHYFMDIDYPLKLLLFPEGTDYDPNTLAKSKDFAMKNNLQIYKHVLHPRLKGFTYCVQQLQKRGKLDAIHDVTVGYRGCLPRSELDLIMGNFPQEVHFNIKRYPISEIPESEEELEQWCKDRWAEKEEVLERFYKNENFASEEKKSVKNERKVRWELIFWITYWLNFVLIMPPLMYYFPWLRWFMCCSALIFFMLATFGNGFDSMQIWRHSLSRQPSDHQNNYSSYSYLDRTDNGKVHSK